MQGGFGVPYFFSTCFSDSIVLRETRPYATANINLVPRPKTPNPEGTNPHCMAFARSSTFCNNTAGMREQFNGVTAFIDASQVYGSTTTMSRALRTFRHGLKKTSRENLCPHDPNDRTKIMAGDERARENVQLAAIHVIFMREHNRISRQFDQLLSGQPGSTKDLDEECFQRTRRLLWAQMQNIVYGQFLTVLLGTQTMQDKNLTFDLSQEYNPNTNPGIRNSFATAAYRFGHSGLQSTMEMRTPYEKHPKTFHLRDHFFNLDLYYESGGLGTEKLILGMLYQAAKSIDHFFTQDVTRMLFGNANGIGQDLVARNIQRGRDHGLPGYNVYREFCGMPRACSWNNPPEEIDPWLWTRLSQFYDRPSDIDLFVGGVVETPYQGGVVGRTFNCILSQQFHDLKFGDR